MAIAWPKHPLLGLQAGHVQPPDLLQIALPRRVRARQLVLELLAPIAFVMENVPELLVSHEEQSMTSIARQIGNAWPN